MNFLKQFWNKFLGLKIWQKAIVLILVLSVGGAFTGPSDTAPTSGTTASNEATTAESSNELPKIDGDDILKEIIKDFYEDNQNAKWWGRVDKVVEGVLSDEAAKMVYIKTNYQLNSVDDVEQGTLLCNALISYLPRKGLSIRVDGLITEGRTLLDGSIESVVKDDPITYFGSSANPDGVPEWCVARTLFYDVVDGLKKRGWKQQYGYGSLTAEEQEKMFEGAFMQKGPIYLKD